MSDRLMCRRLAIAILASSVVSGPVGAAELLDPTRPAGWREGIAVAETKEPAPAAWRLQGIFSGAGGPSAVIDGRRVGLGASLAGAEVIEIAKNRVVLEVNGERVELAASSAAVKSPVNKDRGER